MTPVNNIITDISGIPKEEEHKTTFNIGIEEPNNTSNSSLDILNNNQASEQSSIPSSPIPEININSSNETL